jgi:hypothetical protein
MSTLLCLALLGCAEHRPVSSQRSSSSQATPRPSPSASPLPITGNVSEPKVVLSNGKGNRRLELSGGHFALLAKGGAASLTGTHAVLYEAGKPALRIAARLIQVPKDGTKLTAEGSVSVQAHAGVRLQCEQLTWVPGADLQAKIKDQDSNTLRNIGTLSGQGKIAFMSGSDFVLYGSSFTADTQLQTLKILP